jgi:hypothetical protein
MNSTYVAASKHMFIRIHIRPQSMYTYGQYMANSDGTEERLVPVGTPVKFLSSIKYFVATTEMVDLMRSSIEPEVRSIINETVPAKRPCVRPLDIGGEQADEREDVHLHFGSRRSYKTNEEQVSHTAEREGFAL